ncbi:MAG: hypothetical protein KKA31_05225 [Candidatus Margulisbacteria bacterium]|nr:hypothetical protein [Candidatus Margulisiibacteriota bacterium]
MKKVLIAMLIAVIGLSVASFAVTAGKVGVGIETAGGNLVVGNCTSFAVRYNFTEQIIGKLGLNYSNEKNIAGVENSQSGLSLSGSYVLPYMMGDVAPLVGLQYSTDGASTATSIISLLLGVEAEVADGMVLGFGLIPYSTASMSGNTDSSISTGTGNMTGRGAYISAAVYVN